VRRIEDGMAKAFPCSAIGVDATLHRYWEAHPEAVRRPPTPAATAALYEASERWSATCPDVFYFAERRFFAAKALPGLDPRTLIAVVDRYVGTWETFIDAKGRSSPYAHAAAFLLERQLDLERVGYLLEEEAEWIRRDRLDTASGPTPEYEAFYSVRADLRSVDLGLMRADLQVRLGDLASAAGELERQAKAITALEGFVSQHAEAWLAQDRRLGAPDTLAREAREALQGRQAKRVRLAHELSDAQRGGTASRALGREAGLTQPWKRVERGLPEFELTDLQGRTWRREDFRGKAVLLNVWSTGCATCRSQLPYLQKLHETVKARPDIALLSLNVDADAEPVAPYLEQARLTFPVLMAERFWKSLEVGEFWLNPLGTEHRRPPRIPFSWIVDGKGVARFEREGFYLPDADRFLEDTLRRLEELSRAPGW
jgi:thiol-disulfide isomerase/thioredoxin